MTACIGRREFITLLGGAAARGHAQQDVSNAARQPTTGLSWPDLSGLHGSALRSEGKVVDFHLRVRSLHGGGRKGGRRGEDGGRKRSRDPDVTYDFCHGSGFPASALQRLIDDRKPLLSAFEGDVGDAE
jgi:hypothetical protein